MKATAVSSPKPHISRPITVNGRPCEVCADTLEAALGELGYGGAKIATALNGEFVAAGQRGVARLADGDRLEIVAARAGG